VGESCSSYSSRDITAAHWFNVARCRFKTASKTGGALLAGVIAKIAYLQDREEDGRGTVRMDFKEICCEDGGGCSY
jgi:hypothetical protein